MAREVQLSWSCPHLILEERVNLPPDRRSLPTVQPVASDSIVAIIADNEVQIPRAGLYAPAKLVSFQAGPYSLIENETTLTISTSTENFSVNLPSSTFLTADEVALTINRASPSKQTYATSERGRITLSDLSNVGARSIVQVSGAVLLKLHLDKQTGAQGRMVYPPWQLYTPPVTFPKGNYALQPADAERELLLVTADLNDPTTLPSQKPEMLKQQKYLQEYLQNARQLLNAYPTRYPRFVTPVMGNPLLTVSYVTAQGRCLRCKATGVENDYRFTATSTAATSNTPAKPAGDVFMVTNEDLLYQAALKIVLTQKGSNPFHPSYGSSVMSRIGSKSVTATAAQINQDVRRALQILQDTQASQSKYQPVTARERLYAILGVSTSPDEYDPTVYYVNVTVQNASTTPIVLNIVYATSGVNSRNGKLVLGNQAFGGSTWR